MHLVSSSIMKHIELGVKTFITKKKVCRWLHVRCRYNLIVTSLADICGRGRCVDNEYSFDCYCPLGVAGRRCEREINIYEPAFTKDAYIAYPPLPTQHRFKASLKIKPRSLDDGILLYASENDEGYGDFASVALKDGHVEFRYNVGNGTN